MENLRDFNGYGSQMRPFNASHNRGGNFRENNRSTFRQTYRDYEYDASGLDGMPNNVININNNNMPNQPNNNINNANSLFSGNNYRPPCPPNHYPGNRFEGTQPFNNVNFGGGRQGRGSHPFNNQHLRGGRGRAVSHQVSGSNYFSPPELNYFPPPELNYFSPPEFGSPVDRRGKGPGNNHNNYGNRQRPPGPPPGGHSNNQPHQKKVKQKIDKRDMAENNRFSCETCDRGFKTEDKYQEHIAGHVKCGKDGCSFTAAAKLVKIHQQTQHRNGLAKKVWSLESPEDIAKWREERRKKFPTKENIERKKRIDEEKIARGDVIETKRFGKMRGRGRGRGRGRRNNKYDNHEPQSDKPALYDGTCDATSPLNIPEGLKTEIAVNAGHENARDKLTDPQVDPLSILLTQTDKDKDSESETDVVKTTDLSGLEAISSVDNGLGSLISSYGDLSDSGLESDGAKVAVEPKLKTNEQTDSVLSSGKDKNVPQHNKKRQNRNRRQRKRKKNRKSDTSSDTSSEPAWKRLKRPSLLEKLLSGEIRQERNLILQCVRYIVTQNFLGVGQPTNSVSDNVKNSSTDNLVEEAPSRGDLATESNDHLSQSDCVAQKIDLNEVVNGTSVGNICLTEQLNKESIKDKESNDSTDSESAESDNGTSADKI